MTKKGLRTSRIRRRFARLAAPLLIAFILWSAGLIAFALSLRHPTSGAAAGKADAIVVLTGSAGRVQAGISALENGLGERLLISGVNPDLAPSIIRAAIGAESEKTRCCVDLGPAARDTEGNAREAVSWAEAHGYRSLLVVTSDWHMKRALIEFRRGDHDLRLLPLPVSAETGAWRILVEYNKYLMARLRALLS